MSQIVKDIFTSRSNVIEYTADQRGALEKILEWEKSGERYFLLSGYAGTGKTTIAENIAVYFKADVMAPTNAAVKRLREKIINNSTSFSTLHSALYGGPDEKTGEFKKGKGLDLRRVYIVDECSMIDEQVLLDLLSEAKKASAKIIFMGDGFQLEPVGKDPQIFSWNNSNMEFKEEWMFTLYEVKRNDGAILKVATHLRQSNECHLIDNGSEDFSVVKKFSPELIADITGNKSYILLTSTNNKRLEYNRLIRGVRYKDEIKNPINDYERVISVANTLYNNGEQYVIRNPVVLDTFRREIDTGTKNNPVYGIYSFVFIEHEIETTDPKFIDRKFQTLLVTDLDKPSLHPSMLMKINSFKFDKRFTTAVYFGNKRVLGWKSSVIISTYGYATSTHKA